MRRIFTSAILSAALVAASFNSFGQTCTVSTTNPNPTPAFGQTLAINSGNGFTTPATPTTIHQTTLGTWDKGHDDQLFSPIYYYNTAQSTINFKYDLSAVAQTGTVSPNYSIKVIYGANGAQNFTCSGTWAGVTAITTTVRSYYFSISGITFPASTNFQIILTLSTTNADKDIIGAAFQANAILAASGTVLPVKFSSFDAKAAGGNVNLNWSLALEENVSGYDVEKSNDGSNFTKIGFVNATGTMNYAFTDTKISEATSYYRIKAVDIDGKFSYSTVVTMKGGKSSILLKAFPMPAVNELTLQHNTATNASQISISSAEGRTIKAIVPGNGTQQTVINISSFKPGIYVIRFSIENGETETLKFVKK